MDLLGAYGSDSDDSSTGSSNSSSKNHSSPVKKADPIKDGTKKGKRLLQLNAILPQAILDRLSRPESDSDDDDDDDENDVPFRSNNQPPKKSQSSESNNTFGSLLDDLRSAAPSTTAASDNTMGLAFTTSTVTRSISTTEAVDVHHPPDKDKAESTKRDPTNHLQEEQKARPDLHRPNMSHRATARSGISAAPAVASRLPSNPPSTSSSHTPIIPPQQPRPQQLLEKPILSKREMEKALRAGNFQQVFQQQHLVELEGAPAEGISATTPEDWKQIQITHGKKVNLRGLVSYDPKAGTDATVQDVSQKHRSKHQIHQLMASAAILEAQRNTSTSSRNQHRANAKRKYGW